MLKSSHSLDNYFSAKKLSIVSIVSQTFLRSCFISCFVFLLSIFTAEFCGKSSSYGSTSSASAIFARVSKVPIFL